MALLAQRKDRLYQFIVHNFDEESYMHDEELESDIFAYFTSYAQFMNYQRQNVDALNADTLTVLEYVIQLLPNIELMDKEDTIPMPADGLIFLNGKIIFTYSR